MAKALHISTATLRRWADAGRITAVRTQGGHRRYPVAEVSRLLSEAARDRDDGAAPPTGPLPGVAELLLAEGEQLFNRAAEDSNARWGPDPRRRRARAPIIRQMVAAARSGRYEPLCRHVLASMRDLLLHGSPYELIAQSWASLEVVVYGRLIELGRTADAAGWRVMQAYLRDAMVRELSPFGYAGDGGWRLDWRSLENAGRPFMVADYAGRILDVNAAAERLLDRTAETLVGHDVIGIVPPRLHARYRDAVNARAPVGLLGWTGETVSGSVLRRDGQEVPVEMAIAEVTQADGQSAVLVELRDRRPWLAAVERAQHLEALAASAPVAMWSADARLTVVTWNDTAAQLLGWRADEIVGRPLATLVPPERLAELHDLYARVIAGGCIEDERVRRLHKEGRYVDLRCWISPVRAEDGVKGLAVVAQPDSLTGA